LKALVYTEYGSPDVLRIGEVPQPVPGQGEVLVRVQATGLNMADWYQLNGKPFVVRMVTGAILRPKHTILGADIAGLVEAVGPGVTAFQPGDAVFGDISSCGWGGLAEFVSVPENVLTAKPTGLGFEQAAAVPMAAVTAYQGLRKGGIRAGQKVMIYGASGGVGSFAVQIARAFGAEVTAVCSTGKMEIVRSLGADHVIDYTREDFAQNGQHYDLILAANGNRKLSEYRRALTPVGAYVCTGGKMSQIFGAMLLGPLLSKKGGQTLTSLAAQPDRDDLIAVAKLLEAGKVIPVIDRCYALDEAPDAFHTLGEGHTQGKLVITLTNGHGAG
jgi:NADPH:quinone reductase-like Zn-dependent oxidoreductase